MPPKRFSTIAHAHHGQYNPVSDAALDRMLGLCRRLGALPDGARVLDLGAGPAEASLRALAVTPGAHAWAVDISPDACAEATRRAAARGLSDRLTVVEANAQTHLLRLRDAAPPTSPFDLILCVGSTHCFGGYGRTLTDCAPWLAPGGLLLVGEGFWQQPPHPDYLTFLGAQPDDYLSHAGNVALAERRHYTPLYSLTASADDWDHYEGLYAWSVEDFCARNPDDPDAPAFRDRVRDWRRAYLTWGRDTLGFGLYLLRAPTPAPSPSTPG